MNPSAPRNLGDLAAYIHQRFREPSLAERLTEARIQAGVAVERICEKSAGNFLYAVNALDGIARDFYSCTNLDALPRGLDGLYLDYRAAIECLPEGETERRTGAARQAELDRYARDMAQYAAAW
jgi:hypothetical protein